MASVLVIDDDLQVRTFMARGLKQAGYQVVEASGAWEGLRSYRGAPTDLVITDILMPEHDGLEAIFMLRREYPEARIMAVTGGSGDTNFLDVAKLLGANRTLVKPFELDALVEAVESELHASC